MNKGCDGEAFTTRSCVESEIELSRHLLLVAIKEYLAGNDLAKAWLDSGSTVAWSADFVFSAIFGVKDGHDGLAREKLYKSLKILKKNNVKKISGYMFESAILEIRKLVDALEK